MTRASRPCQLCNGTGFEWGVPCNGCGGSGRITRHDAPLIVETMNPADRLTTLEAAVRKVIDLVNAKLPPDSKMSDRDFISEVAGAVDNPDVFRALEKVR